MRRHMAVAILVCTAAVLLWVGAYYAMVGQTSTAVTGIGPWEVPLEPRYRYGGNAAEWLFFPVHSIDRRLRPDTWVIRGEPGRGFPPLE